MNKMNDLFVYVVYFNEDDATEVEATCEEEAIYLAEGIARDGGEKFVLDSVECVGKYYPVDW